MRILVTGVTGQVGGALVTPLSGFAEVIAADRHRLDLARPDLLEEMLDQFEPDLIVNAAAYTAVDRAEDEPDLAYRINRDAPEAMARWAARRDAPLLQFSTDYVFDGAGNRPWREDDPPRPLSVYGASKLAGEQAVRAAGGPHLIVRTSWVYDATGRNFLRTMARLARNREQLRVVADQFGAPTSAALIAWIVATILQRPEGIAQSFRASGGVLHLAASGVTTWYGFAQSIVDGLRDRGEALQARQVVAITSAEYPARAARPHNSRLDLSRLRQVFGIEPPTWQSALQPVLDHFVAGERVSRGMRPTEI